MHHTTVILVYLLSFCQSTLAHARKYRTPFACKTTETADFQVDCDILRTTGSKLPHCLVEPYIIITEKLSYV